MIDRRAPNLDAIEYIPFSLTPKKYEIIKLLLDLEYLNGYELAYIFLCNDISQYDSLANSIKKFREISDIKTYVKLYRPRYTISIGKNEMFFKHEFKRSGLSASIGGQVIDKGNEVVSHVERAN